MNRSENIDGRLPNRIEVKPTTPTNQNKKTMYSIMSCNLKDKTNRGNKLEGKSKSNKNFLGNIPQIAKQKQFFALYFFIYLFYVR